MLRRPTDPAGLGPVLWLALPAVIAVWMGVLACGDPPPEPPSAVIDAAPDTICIGDDFRTTVVLDASASAAVLTLIPTPSDEELRFAWSFSGGDYKLRDETTDSSEVVHVATAGDRPLHVSLRVRNEGGGESTALRTISISTPAFTPCDAGACAQGFSCVAVGGEEVCRPTAPCSSDGTCPVCMECVDGGCVPREDAIGRWAGGTP